ncbi:hypothetical protein CPB83DRAFT_888227 [Crepidotus variabilis]|uniref:DinB-like domain-containing protein n=1 Tax=Crepidotus variabilis TaxID=179855 RepID=A0A9P6ESU6_9AGAR|nr:hypothetical protein CPB83DRAFT_888227 [Crepidotus variabilis]
MTFSESDFAAASRQEVVEQQLSVAKTVLLQAVDLIDNHLTSDDQLTIHSKYMPGSTIGKHLRHARDHYVLLLSCVKKPEAPRAFSYDTRIRNTPMETQRQSAKESILETVAQLEEFIPNVNFDEEISLEAVTPYMHSFKTTIGREVWFASLHCVHHWSMVRVIAGEIGITLSDDFGFAPSTLVFNDKSAPLGKVKL